MITTDKIRRGCIYFQVYMDIYTYIYILDMIFFMGHVFKSVNILVQYDF